MAKKIWYAINELIFYLSIFVLIGGVIYRNAIVLSMGLLSLTSIHRLGYENIGIDNG